MKHDIDKLNLISRRTFIPGPDLTFDEGGISSRSRMNPVRQYNKDKPNKFRVDFFVLANNTSEKFFTIHLDVYQGKNAANIGIPGEIQTLPTTQNAVINAIMQSKIANDPNGKRCVFMDSRYPAAALFILLREQCNILCSETIRKNRIGWSTEQMNLTKSMPRGMRKVLYNHVNKVMATKWVDNKVVSCTSTLQVSGEVPVQKRSGTEILNLMVEKSLKCYHEGMGGVDRGDQYQELGAGFALKAHYKKWYKKAYFFVLDFMTLNAFLAWNLSAEDPIHNRFKLEKFQFYAALAKEMILFNDNEYMNVDDRDDGNVVEHKIRRGTDEVHAPITESIIKRPY